MKPMSPIAGGTLLAAGLLAAACSRPDFPTDLNPEGPPEVMLVAVTSESAGEIATFCNDTVDPLKVNAAYCIEGEAGGGASPVMDAQPLGTEIRIAFDELLDPSIETLTTDADGVTTGSIVGADPVTVQCDDTDVAYEGFYQPSGSHLTFPAGPALVIQPTDVVRTGAPCTVSIAGTVQDKDGESVPGAQQGPYDWGIAALGALGTEPGDASEGVDPATIIAVTFNNVLDDQTITATVNDGTADVEVTAALAADDPTTVTLTPTAGTLAEMTTFTVTISAGLADPLGGALAEDVTFSFITGVADTGM